MSAQWIKPVTDRTAADIDSKNEKAFLNAGDFNRIESDISYISELLNRYGYPVCVKTKTDWACTDIPTTDDLRRIVGGIAEQAGAFYAPAGYMDISDIPSRRLGFADINRLENDILLLKELIGRMESGFKKTGIKSGAALILPIRREK